MSSPQLPGDQVIFSGSGTAPITAAFNQSGAAQINALDLTKDSSGAITLDQSNLQKLAAAKLIDFNSATGQYSLSVSLLAPTQSASATSFTFIPAADGVFTAVSAAQAAQNLLSTGEPAATSEQTTSMGAVQLLAAAPSQNHENPYLAGQQAKLMILMYGLISAQQAIAVYEKDSTQKTFSRAIDNVQMQAIAISDKYAAEDVALKGDETAAQMSIGVTVMGMLLQAGALGGLSALGKPGRGSGAESEGDSSTPSTDTLTLTEERRAQEEGQAQQLASTGSRAEQERTQREIEDDRSSSEIQPRDVEDDSNQRLTLQREEDLNAPDDGPSSRLTLTPEEISDRGDGLQSIEGAAAPTARRGASALADLARGGLEAILDKNGLGNMVEEIAKNYVQVVHSSTNITSYNMQKLAEQGITGLELQNQLIKQQLSATRSQSKDTDANVERLVDLVASLSSQRLVNERTLFRG